MDQATADALFRAHTNNVRELVVARNQIRRAINDAIRRGDAAAEKAHTLVYALLLCAWSEANFQKLIHTSHGFALVEIEQIKRAANNIQAGWRECIAIGLNKTFAANSGFKPNAEQKLNRLLDIHIVGPSRLRNKIAHGQWHTATNSDQDALNLDVTAQLQQLDVVIVDRWFAVQEKLAGLIEFLVEMKRKFPNRYYAEIVAVEAAIEGEAHKTITQKRAMLRKKLSYKKVQTCPCGLSA